MYDHEDLHQRRYNETMAIIGLVLVLAIVGNYIAGMSENSKSGNGFHSTVISGE